MTLGTFRVLGILFILTMLEACFLYTPYQIVVFKVKGQGVVKANIPRGKAQFLAERAAIVDAYRQLAEKVHGSYIDSNTGMNEGGVDYDAIHADTEALIRNMEVIHTDKTDPELIEIEMQTHIKVYKGHPLYKHETHKATYSN